MRFVLRRLGLVESYLAYTVDHRYWAAGLEACLGIHTEFMCRMKRQ